MTHPVAYLRARPLGALLLALAYARVIGSRPQKPAPRTRRDARQMPLEGLR